MRLRTLVLVTVVGLGGLGFVSTAEAQRRPNRSASSRSYSSSRSYRPAPRYYNNSRNSYRYSRPYSSYNYNYRPYSYSYAYRPYVYGYSYDPYYYAPPYYEPYYESYYYRTPPYVPYVRYRGHRPRVGISLHLGW